jgi:hypothetical protein
MFFVRIDEWGWDQAPARVPMFGGELPRQGHRLPQALDDAAAAKLLRAAHNDNRLLVRVTVEVLLRTGLRVGEYTALRADAVVQIGAGAWLHIPVGKLHDDRYLPLHPHLVALIDDYRSGHIPPKHPLLLPRENGKALDRHWTDTPSPGSSTRPAQQPACRTSTPPAEAQARDQDLTWDKIEELLGPTGSTAARRYQGDTRTPTRTSPMRHTHDSGTNSTAQDHVHNAAMRALGQVSSDLSNLVRMGFSWNDSRRAFADAAMWFVRMVDLVGDSWSEPGLGEWDPRPGGPYESFSPDRRGVSRAACCGHRDPFRRGLLPCDQRGRRRSGCRGTRT